MTDKTEPLNNAHNQVDSSTSIRGREFPDEVVELAACWADAEEEGYFDEEDYEGAGTINDLLAKFRSFV
jgi:hypothetical protein